MQALTYKVIVSLPRGSSAARCGIKEVIIITDSQFYTSNNAQQHIKEHGDPLRADPASLMSLLSLVASFTEPRHTPAKQVLPPPQLLSLSCWSASTLNQVVDQSDGK
ncbi:hypothetical protein D4764_10G0010560 [Takifugu flavidus]|uniref:Uncharacterized protein n=1 Tax=Takifugu flavidus TaxID=433684 RepID=A0A5C6PM69_9TELE|nr:hypothetical protein D4764_10G0010560 [Takifugu flavidus]